MAEASKVPLTAKERKQRQRATESASKTTDRRTVDAANHRKRRSSNPPDEDDSPSQRRRRISRGDLPEEKQEELRATARGSHAKRKSSETEEQTATRRKLNGESQRTHRRSASFELAEAISSPMVRAFMLMLLLLL